MYRWASKNLTFSTHDIDATIHDNMKRFSPKCWENL